MIRLPILTIKRIIGEMVDTEDRRLIAQGIVIVVTVVLGLIVLAAAAGLAWNVFQFMGRF